MSAPSFSLVTHRGVIAVGGPDRVDFLQGLISNDTTKVAPGRAIWAALLTPQGRFLNDMFVADGGDEMLLLETERERAAALARKLGLYKLRSKVTVEDRSAAMEVAVVFGPGAEAVLPLEGADGLCRSAAGRARRARAGAGGRRRPPCWRPAAARRRRSRPTTRSACGSACPTAAATSSSTRRCCWRTASTS